MAAASSPKLFRSRSHDGSQLAKVLGKSVQGNIQYLRQIGSLGFGCLKSQRVRDFVRPIAKSLHRMPRLPTCLEAVEDIQSSFAICPVGKDTIQWITAEAEKLHKWLLMAKRSTLRFGVFAA